MHSLQGKEDINALMQEYLVDWQHPPYRPFFQTNLEAARCYLSQFKQLGRGIYKADGSLFLYSSKDILFGIRYLSTESKNFGMHCARLEPAIFTHKDDYGKQEILQAAEFLGNILNELNGPLHLSAVAACDDIFCQQVLQACGFRVADTMAGYHVKLAELPVLAADPAIRTVQTKDVPRLAEIAALCFSQHRLNINRFNSEPAFNKNDVGRIYAEWFTRAVVQKDADLVLVHDDGQLSGFMTWRLPPAHESMFGISLGRAVLSAVDPTRHGQGIYRRLLLTGAQWMHEQGVTLIEGKMHLSNHAPIRCWQRLNPRLAITYNTFHWSSPVVAGLGSVEAIIADKKKTSTI
jgi:GNAT superfamily N-acetyltransferase